MGNAVVATKRACENLWHLSTSKSLAAPVVPQTPEQIEQERRERALLEAEQRVCTVSWSNVVAVGLHAR